MRARAHLNAVCFSILALSLAQPAIAQRTPAAPAPATRPAGPPLSFDDVMFMTADLQPLVQLDVVAALELEGATAEKLNAARQKLQKDQAAMAAANPESVRGIQETYAAMRAAGAAANPEMLKVELQKHEKYLRAVLELLRGYRRTVLGILDEAQRLRWEAGALLFRMEQQGLNRLEGQGKLELTDAQIDKFSDACLEAAQKLLALGDARTEARVQPIMDRLHETCRQALTPEQRKKLGFPWASFDELRAK